MILVFTFVFSCSQSFVQRLMEIIIYLSLFLHESDLHSPIFSPVAIRSVVGAVFFSFQTSEASSQVDGGNINEHFVFCDFFVFVIRIRAPFRVAQFTLWTVCDAPPIGRERDSQKNCALCFSAQCERAIAVWNYHYSSIRVFDAGVSLLNGRSALLGLAWAVSGFAVCMEIIDSVAMAK